MEEIYAHYVTFIWNVIYHIMSHKRDILFQKGRRDQCDVP